MNTENNNDDNIYNYKYKPKKHKSKKKNEKKGFFQTLFRKKEKVTKTEEDVFYENFYNVNNNNIDNNENNNNYEYSNIEFNYQNQDNTSQDGYIENYTTDYSTKVNSKTIGMIIAFILLIVGLIWFLILSITNNDNNNKITTNLTNLGLVVNQNYQLNTLNENNEYIKFETNDTTIINLNEMTGYITALKEGNATINILNKDNKVEETINIYVVKNKILLENFEVSNNITLEINQKKIIPLTLTPNNATEHTFTYKVADPSIINVSNGIIEGINKGTTTISITNGNINKTITITVK